jgi:hemerythrin superfamily protein
MPTKKAAATPRKSAAAMSTRKVASEKLDAIALLKADHRAVEELFASFESASTSRQKGQLAQQICLELAVHTQIEEEIFYPAVADQIDEHITEEAYVEHDGAKMLLAEIANGSPDDDFFDAKVKVLSEEIKHHVKEEEQRDGMFAQAKRAGVDLDMLGEELMARKQELMAQFKASGIPTPETRSMKGAKLRVGQPIENRA